MVRARREASCKLERRAQPEYPLAHAAAKRRAERHRGWGNRLFLATFEPYKPGAPKISATILGHAIDANTGKILWSVRLEGTVPSPMMYAYSDSTSPSPVTDGKYVWFFNASGEMGCWDFSGKKSGGGIQALGRTLSLQQAARADSLRRHDHQRGAGDPGRIRSRAGTICAESTS